MKREATASGIGIVVMHIEISDNLANSLHIKAIQAGFESVEAYLQHLVAEQEPARDETAMDYDQWREKFWTFLKSQTSRNPNFDDSRESIYLGP